MPSSPAIRQWSVPVGIVLGLVLLIVLSNRPIQTQEGLPIISDVDTYNQVLKQAEALSRKNFEKYDRGEELTDPEKAELRQAATQFDAMDMYQPTKTGPFMGSGKAYQILGEYEVADERLRQCISNGQYDQTDEGIATVIEAKYLLSLVRGQEGDWKTAYSLAAEAAKAVPNSAYYLTAKASSELQLKKIVEAKTDLAQALVLDPKNRRAAQLQKLIDMADQTKGP